MMFLFFFVIFFVALVVSPELRCVILNPLFIIRYVFTDLYNFWRSKSWNLCPSGELICYSGLFGKGKTLSAVREIVYLYDRYNGKKVWCPRRGKIVTQIVEVISNVKLEVPYEDFKNLYQLVEAADTKISREDEQDALIITLVLGDEFSVQLNSRQFKSNLTADTLNSILTCRHSRMSLFYTAQRFAHVDKLLRQVTALVIDCDKVWRFIRHSYYDAWDLETAGNPHLVLPLRRKCWFVIDEDFFQYDTYARVGVLKKSLDSGQMATEQEVIANQGWDGGHTDGVRRLRKRYKNGKN